MPTIGVKVKEIIMDKLQMPRRKLVLFRGVCCFFYYFSYVLFGSNENFRKFANGIAKSKEVVHLFPI